MLGRLTEDSELTSFQLIFVHSKPLRLLFRSFFPKGWSPGEFKTSGDINAQRIKLEILSNRMLILNMISFVCKSVSVFTLLNVPDIDASARSGIYCLTVLVVQALPNALVLVLFTRYFFAESSKAWVPEQDSTTPLVVFPAQEPATNVEAPMTRIARLRRYLFSRRINSVSSETPLVEFPAQEPATNVEAPMTQSIASDTEEQRPGSPAVYNDTQEFDSEGVGLRWMNRFRRYVFSRIFNSRSSGSSATPWVEWVPCQDQSADIVAPMTRSISSDTEEQRPGSPAADNDTQELNSAAAEGVGLL
jgi:hypothetical protein